MDNALQTVPAAALAPMNSQEVLAQVKAIQDIMKNVLQKSEPEHNGKPAIDGHYGLIPGCGNKPALFKSGAEKLAFTFRLHPQVDKEQIMDLPNGHREYRLTVGLYTSAGICMGQGVGSCSTMETKYRWRDSKPVCPECGKETIFKSRQPGQEGSFYCWNKKGGCGATFPKDAPEIIDQPQGKSENPDPADCYNTCYKMAHKRALVSATLVSLACSDIFTQDIEENIPGVPGSGRAPAHTPAPAGQDAPPPSTPAPGKDDSTPYGAAKAAVGKCTTRKACTDLAATVAGNKKLTDQERSNLIDLLTARADTLK